MSEKSIIIIGAGLAGLAAGVYAQMNGYRSHIFEHHSKPGGVAATWKRKGYLIDGGIHFLMGHRPGQAAYDLYRELGAVPDKPFPDIDSYGRFVDEASGAVLEITGDLDKLARDLKAISPDDAALIDDLIAGAKAGRGMDAFGMMSLPPELMGPVDQLKMYWGMRKLFKYFGGKYSKPMAEYAQAARSPLLRTILTNFFTPEVPVWFVFMLLALLADHQMGLLPQGCLGFVEPMAARYQALGGQITYKATVKEIVVENNCAVGVRLADGSEHRAAIIVSAADGYSTIFQMLGGRYVDDKTQDRYQRWPLIRPTVMVNFGVAREFKDDPHLYLFVLQNPIVIGSQQVPGFALRIFNYGAVFAPPGKTVVQAMLEVEWDYWNDLQKDRPRYEAEKERIAGEILARLETRYPGISSLVDMTDVCTPYTTWRYTLNYKGAYMGWQPMAETIMTQIPRTLPGLANLYMAGQWVTPGGGVPPALYSGRHVVQILCKRDSKTFRTSES